MGNKQREVIEKPFIKFPDGLQINGEKQIHLSPYKGSVRIVSDLGADYVVINDKSEKPRFDRSALLWIIKIVVSLLIIESLAMAYLMLIR